MELLLSTADPHSATQIKKIKKTSIEVAPTTLSYSFCLFSIFTSTLPSLHQKFCADANSLIRDTATKVQMKQPTKCLGHRSFS